MTKKINSNMTLKIFRINDIYFVNYMTKLEKQDEAFYKEEEWGKSRKK